jgi:hypothetical protein
LKLVKAEKAARAKKTAADADRLKYEELKRKFEAGP